jgi:hypothetical protein
LKCSAQSYIIEYDRSNFKWIFVSDPNSIYGQPISYDICEQLIKRAVIKPYLTEDEFKVQIALGTIDGRIYKFNSEANINDY